VVINRVIKQKYLLVLFVIIALTPTLSFVLWPKISKAEVNNTTISWSASKPTTFSSVVTSYVGQTFCPSFTQSKQLAGDNNTKKVCISLGNKITFGVYYIGSGNTYLSAVSFPLDDKMYKVNGVCGNYDSCLYLPDNDTLVTKQYLINGIVRSLVIYKNFTGRLKKFINPANLSTEYKFNSSNPDYIFRNNSGYAWPIGGIGASNNGEWLAIEFRQRGIGLLNIETLQMKRISTIDFGYSNGMDPTVELAVSNDGNHVATMGNNAGLMVLDVVQDCGDIATDNNMSNVSSIANNCKKSPINVSDFIFRFSNAFRPFFSDDGGELNFFANSYTGETRQVALRASGYVSKMIDYLALGDSFSSGEGESDDEYYLPGTNDEFEKCHVSSRSYPFLVATMLNMDPLKMKNVACSGATTKDVVGDDDLNYPGQGARLIEKGLNLTKVDKVLAQNEAKMYFMPGRIHQESFVKTYSPKIITIGIGGNDTGLMSKLKTCIGQGTCDSAGTAIGKEKTAIEIKNLYGTLVQTYQKLHLASPNSKIYVIGYPKIIDSSNQCDFLNGILLDSTERQFMNEGIIYINQIVKAAAKTVGVGYIDTQDSFGDHVLCGSSQPSAMNAIRTGDDGIISDNLSFLKIVGNESFHPNALGHSLLANSITGTVSNIMTNDYCANGAVVCPVETPAPNPSDYWVSGLYHNYPTQQIANYVYNRSDSYDNRQKSLKVDDASLEPNSTVRIEITSDPKSLGQFQVSASGSLDVDIDLPIDLEEGYHTVHLYGTSYSGESIELYQVIEYKKPVVVINEEPTVVVNVDVAPPDIETIDTGEPSSEVEAPVVEVREPAIDVDVDNDTTIDADVETNITDKDTETIDTVEPNNEVKTPVVEVREPVIDVDVDNNTTIGANVETGITDKKAETINTIDPGESNNEVKTPVDEGGNPDIDVDNTTIDADVETNITDKKTETIGKIEFGNEVKTPVTEGGNPAIGANVDVDDSIVINTDAETGTTNKIDNVEQLDKPSGNIVATSDESDVMGASIVAVTAQPLALQASASDNIDEIPSPRQILSGGVIITSAITLIVILAICAHKFKW